MTISHQYCSKTTTSLFHQFCYHDTQTRPSDQTWLSQNPTKINSFCNKTFHTSFWMHFVTIPHQDFSKTTTSLFHQFCYQGTKTKPSDQTWLSQNPTKINSFFTQTFDTSFCMHLCQFPSKIAEKPRLHVFNNFTTKA